MGQEDTLVIPILVCTSAVLIPSVWLTWKTLERVFRVVKPEHHPPPMEKVTSIGSATDSSMDTTVGIPRQTSTMVVNSNQKSVKHSSHLGLYCTALSSVSYTLSLIVMLISESLLCDRICDDMNDEERLQRIVEKSPLFPAMLTVFLLCYFLANITLAWVSFLRLKNTFSMTRYKLSKRSVKACKTLIIFGGGFFIISIPFLLIKEPVISAIIALPIWIIYPVFFLWIVYRFMSNTRAIASEMTHTRRSASIRQSIDESMMRRSEELLDASLRLTIVTVLATLSTVITIITVGMILLTGSTSRLSFLIYSLDCFCNIYCLHCTFADHSWYYHTFLGWLHRWFLAYLVQTQ